MRENVTKASLGPRFRHKCEWRRGLERGNKCLKLLLDLTLGIDASGAGGMNEKIND